MRAVQVVDTTGPEDVVVREVAEPDRPEAGGDQVLVEVHRVGVSFPDLLLSRGQYQMKPETPFTLGVDVAGTVVAGGDLEPGTRVAAVLGWGGGAERMLAPTDAVLPLPDAVSFDEGAALPMNYLTALFALQERGDVGEGDTVLVHGAAGGVGTASIQVAVGLGARAIGVVSSEEKAEVARRAGASDVVVLGTETGLKDAVRGLTDGRGVDAVVDVVGGDLFTDSLRCLAPLGRLLVVGFAAGQGIPEVKVNRLLLGNIDVRGVGWGAYAMGRPGYLREQWDRLLPMIEAGAVKPPIGATYDLEDFSQALVEMDQRKTLGKSIVRVRD